jgi:hypothetical protein
MKRLLSTILLSIITSITTQAAEMSSELVCGQSELAWMFDKRYFFVADSNAYPIISADEKTIQINRKNKTIKVWTVWLTSEEGRQNLIQNSNQYRDYSSFGYAKHLYLINYKDMRVLDKSYSRYSCNGNVIHSDDSDGSWSDITPGSVFEGIVESIIKKYKLK